MDKGEDVWSGCGNVATEILFSKTRGGDEACSFRLAISKFHKPTVFVRVNAYGGNVTVIKKRGLRRGDFCTIFGELMNRKGQSNDETVTEIRCQTIIIPYGQHSERWDDGDED